MKNDKIIYVILLLVIIFISVGCNNKTSRKEISDLSKSDIESILSLCHDDTLMVLGFFIEFQPDNTVSQPIGQYRYVAELLNRPFETTSDVDSMVKVVHDLYKMNRKTHESMIAVPATFVPKIKITSELRNTELQEYLVSDIHENNLQQTYEIESEKDLVFDYSLSLYKKKDDSKYVSEKTNLAKVFYLQDKKSFIERNKFYYYTVRRKFIKAQQEKNTKEKEDAAQSTWDDYL